MHYNSPLRNLIIVRAGNDSCHEGWMQDSDRNWELIVNYYGDDPARFRSPTVSRIDSKGPKWPALKRLLLDHPSLIGGYEYVCFPDDDLTFGMTPPSSLFRLAREYEFILCQPSLSADSFISHSVTLHHPAFVCRYTNFVEIMAPCFHISALHDCLDTFDESLSGWGLDSLWPRLLAGKSGHIGIIDSIQMTHTRPVGGPNYIHLEANRLRPLDEAAKVIDKYDLSIIHSVSGGIGVGGQELLGDQLALALGVQPTLPRSMPRSPEWSTY